MQDKQEHLFLISPSAISHDVEIPTATAAGEGGI
jgi:hypothetical protein